MAWPTDDHRTRIVFVTRSTPQDMRGSVAVSDGLIDRLRTIVGSPEVLTGAAQTRRFATGYRFGGGVVLAVVRPRTLVELWRTLNACVEAGVIVIMQSPNTGLTGGSTPNGSYDRGVVLINTLRIRGIHPIDGGRQVVCCRARHSMSWRRPSSHLAANLIR
jgi:D-lactate dehydrogenase